MSGVRLTDYSVEVYPGARLRTRWTVEPMTGDTLNPGTEWLDFVATVKRIWRNQPLVAEDVRNVSELTLNSLTTVREIEIVFLVQERLPRLSDALPGAFPYNTERSGVQRTDLYEVYRYRAGESVPSPVVQAARDVASTTGTVIGGVAGGTLEGALEPFSYTQRLVGFLAFLAVIGVAFFVFEDRIVGIFE